MPGVPDIAVIAGPTASGKTELGVRLALETGGEVISADSMQIYRRMDIGTAKPAPDELRGVPHHLIDAAEPWENWSAARWTQAAARCADDILSRGKLPIVVGGTGLYIDSLTSGRDFAESPGDSGLRESLSDDYERLGGEAMLEVLRGFDPERADKLHPSDKRRIVRAVEIYRLTGKTMSEHDRESREQPPSYRASMIILGYADRERLYRRIDARVDDMLNRGLLRETASLLAELTDGDCTSMQAIGYRQAAMALRGELSEGEAVELIKRESRRYAKRQLTWLRRYEDALRIFWDSQPDFVRARRLSTAFLAERGVKW